MANKYIRTYKRISKEWKVLFCRQGKLNHFKSLNLLCTYTIWLFTAFALTNTSNSQQIICIKILFSVMVSHLPFLTTTKRIEAFQSRLMSTSIWCSSLIGIIYSIIYGIVSFFWLYFCSSVQYGGNEIHLARW